MKQREPRTKRNRNTQHPDTRSNDEERKLDEALEETFPASDPPAATQPHDRSPGSRDAPRQDPKKLHRDR